jgi:hypothetical protein
MAEPTERDRERAREIEERIIFRQKEGLDAIGLTHIVPAPKGLAEFLALHLAAARREGEAKGRREAMQWPRPDMTDNEKASHLLMEAADFFAATLATADERAWQTLLIYAASRRAPQ